MTFIKSDKLFYPSTVNHKSIVNKFTFRMNSWSVFIFWWTDEQMNRCIFRYKLVKSAKIKIKTDEETNMSLISADWLIQSISIKSDLPIFSDLSIDYSGILNICQKYWNASKCLCTGRVTTLVLLKLTLGLIKWTIGSVNKEIFSTLYDSPINVNPVGGGSAGKG